MAKWWECEKCKNFLGKSKAEADRHERKTGHRTHGMGFKPVVPTFKKKKSLEDTWGY